MCGQDVLGRTSHPQGGVMRVLAARRLNDKDCAVTLEVVGSRCELVAERIVESEQGLGLGNFAPDRVFADLPLNVRQLRELIRTAVLAHRGEVLEFPVEVPG